MQFLSTDFLTTTHHNSSELYIKAEAELSLFSSLLLNFEVANANRDKEEADIKLVVRTSQGNKLILTKKLLIVISSKLDFLTSLNLSDKEKIVFEKFIDANYNVDIVQNTSFLNNISITNAAQNSKYNFSSLSEVYSFVSAELLELQMIIYVTSQSSKFSFLPDTFVKMNIIKFIKRLHKQNLNKFSQTESKFVDYRLHASYTLQVSSENIKNEFYKKLYALQSLRNTY